MRARSLPACLAALALALCPAQAVASDATQFRNYCTQVVAAYDWCYFGAAHTFSLNSAAYNGYFRKCTVLEYTNGINVTDTVCTFTNATVAWHPNYSTYLSAPIYNGDNNNHNMVGYAEY